jgi:AcrR family transcriptional regulator
VTATPDRRDALIDRVADTLLAKGLDAATLRALAKAVGTSDRMLLYYFPDKAALIAAAAERIAARLMAILNAAPEQPLPPEELTRSLVALSGDPLIWPYLTLWLDIAARAAWGDPFWQGVGHELGQSFLYWTAARIDIPAGPDRDRAALDVLARVEGGIVLRAVGLMA